MSDKELSKYKKDNERLRKRIKELEIVSANKTPSKNTLHSKLLSKLTKHSKFIISVYNIEKREFTFVTKSIFEFLGYPTQAETLNQKYEYNHKYKYIHQDDAEIVRTADKRIPGLSDKCTVDIEYRAKHSDGHWVWLRRETSVFARNSKGNVEQVMTIFEDVSEKRKMRERLTKLNECFLSNTNNYDENINRLLKLCGTMMKADSALYNNLINNNIVSTGMWHVPKDYTTVDKSKGHICADFMKGKFNDEIIIIQNLQNSKYRNSDVNIAKYHLQTYIGVPVKSKNNIVGSLCVVYVKRYEPTENDIEFMTLLSSALSIEEERKRSEQESTDKETSYRKLFNLSPSGILIEKINGDIIDANSEMTKISGYSNKELVGMNVRKFVPPENHKEVDKNISKIISESNIYHEVVNIRKDGTFRNIELRETKIKLPDGSDGILVICNDITNRKRAEQKFLEREETLRILINSTPDVIMFKDGDGRWIEVNDAVIKLFEIDENNYKGKTDIELSELSCSYKEPLLFCGKTDEQTWKNRKTTRTEEIIPQKDGSKKVFDVIKVPLFKSDGSRRGLIIIGRNITDYNKATQDLINAKEDAEAATNIKSDFLATISQEIKIPANEVTGMASLLLETKLNQNQQDTINLIKKSGESLIDLINEVLDFSKIESGNVNLDFNSFSLETCIKEVIDLFTSSKSNNNNTYSYEILKDVPSILIGDVQRIKQIFTNLIDNALKFNTSANLKITIKTEKKSSKKVVLLISIADSDIVIKDELIANYFTPFTTIMGVNNGSGTGLELSISKKLVELMNGKIWVESEEGKGTTIWFTIDITDGDDKLEYKAQEIKEIENGSLSGLYPLKILLVEDNLINQKVTQRILKKIGYDIDIAENGLIALKKVKDKKYDIVFMDIQMPEMDGLEATFQILNKYKEDAPKIIAMTAAVMKGDKEKCLKAGMVDYIPKPVIPEVVYKVLEKWCKIIFG